MKTNVQKIIDINQIVSLVNCCLQLLSSSFCEEHQRISCLQTIKEPSLFLPADYKGGTIQLHNRHCCPDVSFVVRETGPRI